MHAPAHESHAPLYLKIFGALTVLTALTVGVSYIHIPAPFGLLVGLAIAGFKATLVAMFFMHLKWEKALLYYLLGLTAFFAVFLFLLPIIDASWTAGTVVHAETPAITQTGSSSHGSGHH